MFRKFFIIFILFFVVVFTSTDVCYAKKEPKSVDKTSEAPLKGSAVVNLNSDQVDYLQDKDQFVATGNVYINVDGNNTVIHADKVTYDRENDLIIAEKNIKIIKNGQVINGDYARIDLLRDTALINNPDTVLSQIKINAKSAKIYPKKKDPEKKDIDVYNGTVVIADQNMTFVLSSAGAKYITDPSIVSKPINKNSGTSYKQHYKIHSKDVLIKREKEADIITLKHSTITINRYTVAKVPTLTLTTNKETHEVESNLPEIGRKPELGGYVGYGPVFNLPHGSTLKLVPLFTYGSGVGVGGLSRFMSSTNKTEVAYSTLEKKFVVEGHQRLPFSPTTKIQYGRNTYIDNGFFGKQMPALIIEAVDSRKLASACNFDFDLRSSAAFIQTDHRWSTGRYQIQGDLHNLAPLFKLGKYVDVGASSQFDISVYGTGNTYGVVRAGPTMSAARGPFYAWLAFYQGGIYGETPVLADRYYYGKSNVTLRTHYKINRYVTLGYYSSLNLSKDNWDEKLLAENQLYLYTGPDDIKFRIGYDTKRKSATFDFNVLLGSDKSNLDFDKMRVTEN